MPPDVLDDAQGAREAGRTRSRLPDQARDLREWFRGFVRKHMGAAARRRRRSRSWEPLNRLLGTRRGVQPDRHGIADEGDAVSHCERTRRWRSAGSLLLPIGEAMARVGLRGELLRHQGVRGPGLHADVRRSHAGAGAAVVQHGDLRQPRQAGRAHRSRIKDRAEN